MFTIPPVLRRVGSMDMFCGLLVTAVAVKFTFGGALSTPAVSAWTTVFVAICIQATPLLALGIVVSTTISALVPPSLIRRALPARTALAVPLASLAGGVLPGCECGSVPVAAALLSRGVPVGPSLAFLLSAPAINPVVLVATSVAFPGHPAIVLARLLASLATAMALGWAWPLIAGSVPPRSRHAMAADGADRWTRLRTTAAHDLAQSLGLLCIGAAAAATLNVAIPRSWLDGLASSALGGVIALSLLAVLLAVCSEADAFLASSFIQFSMTARLAFMVVGPAVDLKLFALQVGTFGRRFAQRFAPLTLVCAPLAACVVGKLLL